MSPALQELKRLESTGTYLFHGSGSVIDEFEPRQAHNYIEGQQVPDGEPAVFASPFADYAIFMALINKMNYPQGFHSASGFHNGQLTFQATKETLDQLHDSAMGYVYVFNRYNFTKRNDSEWVCNHKVKPLLTIIVHRSDFLPSIGALYTPPMDEHPRPKVGVGVMIFKDGKVLLGKRKGQHGGGEYAGPGGHLEHLESFEECAKRETLEETGMEIENVRFLCVTNLRQYAPKHYVDIGVIADWKSGELKVMEPERCEGWDWYELNAVPEPLFGCEPNYFEALKTGRHYFG